MDFITALKNLVDGKRVFHQDMANGVHEELVLQCGCTFISTPRSMGASKTNFIFSNPTVEQMLSDGWFCEEEE